ncbi:DUF6371 domain-containing protein [Urechidicola croceus]|uniref:DUF6371 domain-containing protein n=1 Tax=Urechidicola croceus TaxID=1850246 RepID=A0A1D8P7Q8_9FLAO|nr:DUF6371 domain-containing protein [Urechidicola croceus]AOW20591.1 hypothetical protein LPB138_07830 [Urechidicola croceus]
MKGKLIKVEFDLEFKKKRNFHLTTPCCHKSNKDGKFVNYKCLNDNYGYCHSCGKSTLPRPIYKDENDIEYQWDELNNCFDEIVLQTYYSNTLKSSDNEVGHCNAPVEMDVKESKYIEKELVLRYNKVKPENNLLYYIRKTYGNTKAELVKNMYNLGTSKDGGTIFWNINKDSKVQKAKISYYKKDGKRTNYFKVPYKNEVGYFSCLFGEHLINIPKNKNKSIILVESEKTAIVSALHLPEFVWLAYGGINGLTNDKLKPLIGLKVILVPDISENAVAIMNSKLPYLLELGIDAKIWDMTNDKNDEQLKNEGWFNCDLEDVFRFI